MIDVKQDRIDRATGRLVAERLVEDIADRRELLPDCLAADFTLVPTPRSSPLQQKSVWPARSVCNALLRHGIGRDVQPLVFRTHAVPKSAGNASRPDAGVHYESFSVVSSLLEEAPSRILLVDDVVTRGCTFLAAARRLREAVPGTEVVAFALARVQSAGEASVARSPVMEWLLGYDLKDCSRVPRLPAGFH